MPQTPPQLPYPNFGGLDWLCDFPQLSGLSPACSPTPPPSYSPRVPNWCPHIPSIFNKKNSNDSLPLFFDFSSLPEQFQSPKPASKCQEVQLWQPKASPQPAKQSRFFPPRPSSPKPEVKLPVTACTLHKNDKGVQVDLPPRPDDHSEPARCAELPDKAAPTEQAHATEASAANLWRILTSKDDAYKEVVADPYTTSFATRHPQDPLSHPHGIFDTRMEAIGMPTELDNTEIPYFHANSLTGHGNERASYPQREVEEHRTVIYDSPMAMTPQEEMFVGLNEMVVDPDFGRSGACDGGASEEERRHWDA